MSAASLLKVYDGIDTELAFLSAGPPGATPNIAAVLGAAPAGDATGLALSDVGALSCLSITKAGAAGPFTISGEAGQALDIVGPVNASLTATTGDVKVEATAGILELAAPDAAGELNIVLDAGKLTAVNLNAAANGPTYLGAVRQLKIQVGGVDYWIALNPAAFA